MQSIEFGVKSIEYSMSACYDLIMGRVQVFTTLQ